MIQRDRFTGVSRHFGFVWFPDDASQQGAIRDHDRTQVHGREISVKKAVPEREVKPGTPASIINRGGSGNRDNDGGR